MTHRHLAAMVTLALGLLLTLLTGIACSGQTQLEIEAFDSGRAVLSFARDPLVTMTEIPFEIELYNANGEAVSNADLRISLDMPAMPMPPNNPKAVWVQDSYQGVAVFTMAGAWQAKIDIMRPGQETTHLVFDIERVMMK